MPYLRRALIPTPFMTALCCLLVVGGDLLAKPIPFGGTSLPEAPQQKVAWTPPQAKLPQTMISAAKRLFDQGLADPRGCEYRQVEVAVGNVWNGGGLALATHAWLLPAEADAKQRFVVCWNGLVYPAVSVGQVADLRADMASLIEKDQKLREAWAKQRKDDFPFVRSWGVTHEGAAVSHESMTPLKVCLLFRLGEAVAAEAYWDQFTPDLRDASNDPYLLLAREWAWCAFDRAVCAHMRGDDGVSVATCRVLSAAQPKIEAAAAERGLKRPLALDNRPSPSPPYIDFLGPLAALLADEERRVMPNRRPLPLDEAVKIRDKAQRIAALVWCLEDVAERQGGQPGGVGLDSSPIVQALEKEGQDAVEPLLDCLEKDERLTRSVSFGRDFHTGRNLLSVSSAAYGALGHLLDTQEFGRGDRKTVAREMRAFWEKAKGKSPAERWYATLADDQASAKQWIEAVGRIVQPVDVEERGGWVNVPQRKPGEVPAIRGTELRAKKDPTVSELMAKRVPQIAALEPNSSMAVFNAGDATTIALALARWDAKSAAPVLRAQIEDCKAKADHWKTYVDTSSLARNISSLNSALAKIGGQGSLKEYGSWVRTQAPTGGRDLDLVDLFEPLWQNPDDPDASAAADWLFSDPASPWRCLPKVHDSFGRNGGLLSSPMIAVAGLQKGVLANLADNSRVGTLSIRNDQPNLVLDTGLSMGFGIIDPADPLLPKPNEPRVVRVCDWYAWQLSKLDGSPEFELYWPEEKRDAAIKDYSAFIRDWASGFRWNDAQQVLYSPPFNSARLTFSRRDRPATAAEEQGHTAIFSLTGAGSARAVALAPFPTKAKWKTLKRFVVHYQTYDPQTKGQKILSSFDQDGLIWQAEEVLEGGAWKRYYGFVGHHVVAKVPAEEIELIREGA